MKALLIIADEGLAAKTTAALRPLGFDIIHYRDALKAMDNIQEICPQAALISAGDFPRHWGLAAKALRSSPLARDCAIILIKGEGFSVDDAAEAAALGVNGSIGENLDERGERLRFQKLLKRYAAIKEARGSDRLVPQEWDRIELMFSHPTSLALVTGRVGSVSPGGFSFMPDDAALVEDLRPETLLRDCSLRAGNRILSLSCVVVRKGREMGLRISAMDEVERAAFNGYLESCPERAMKARLKSRD